MQNFVVSVLVLKDLRFFFSFLLNKFYGSLNLVYFDSNGFTM